MIESGFQKRRENIVPISMAGEKAEGQRSGHIGNGRRLTLIDCPSDVLSEIFSCLSVRDILRLELTSHCIKAHLSDHTIWRVVFPVQCPHITLAEAIKLDLSSLRGIIVNRNQRKCSMITFLKKMKDERCVDRFDNPSASRFSKKDRDLSHPLPLLDNAYNNSPSNGKMMTTTDVLNRDYRSVVLSILGDMLDMTSFDNDEVSFLFYLCYSPLLFAPRVSRLC